MKRLTLTIALALAIIVSAFSQKPTMELTFTASYYDEYIVLDSVYVQNLTQGGDTMLNAPDTVLVLDFTTSTTNFREQTHDLQVMQNFPNPFQDKTTINIFVPEKQNVEIIVTDALGKQSTSLQKDLNAGGHSFSFKPGNEKCYFLSVIGNSKIKTIKMINTGNSKNRVCKLAYENFESLGSIYKAQTNKIGFIYSMGDSLRFIGYASISDTIIGSFTMDHSPLGDETYPLEIVEGIPCPGTPLVYYKNQFYQTVQIGDQCWMKENLNVGSMISSDTNQTNNGLIEKYCYNDDSNNCFEYGGLYQWNECMDYITIIGAQGICPVGWHIPDEEDEWCIISLFHDQTVDCYEYGWSGIDGGYKMKTTHGWLPGGEGLNRYGFSGQPGGFLIPSGFTYKGFWGFWWSSTEQSSTHAWGGRSLQKNESGISRGVSTKDTGRSVRCVKN